jgi:hypothetical protein
MPYKIELRYFYGWDDAGWTDEKDEAPTPLRFDTANEAQTALDEFFNLIKAAIVAGNMDIEENRHDYRIVEARE